MMVIRINSKLLSHDKKRTIRGCLYKRLDKTKLQSSEVTKMMMDAELNHRISYELKMLEHARSQYVSRMELLNDCRGSFLRRTKPGNGKYYYYSVKCPGSKSYSYLGTSDHRVVKRVREARFLKEAIRRIDRDIALMKSLTEGFLPFDPSSISECLPAIYRCEVPPVSKLYECESKKWLASRLEFQKRFPENYPEKKRHTTSDRISVKTVSEALLYERLKAAGLALIYELPFLPNDHGPALYPDITVLSPIDMKTEIIIEYVGRMDLLDYRGDFARRVGRYIDSGYTPGVNLFFVFSKNDGYIDSTQITKVINDIFGN